jgi:hypothetical protein
VLLWCDHGAAMPLTADSLIHGSGILKHPEYEDVKPITDAPGFYAFRRYPADTELAQVVTKDGRAAIRCYVAVIIQAPASPSPISAVSVRAWLAPRWRDERRLNPGRDPFDAPPGHPDAPRPDSVPILAKARLPIALDDTDATYIYDHRENVFLGEDGRQLSPIQILDEMYWMHCRTLGLWFRIRWAMGSAVRHVVRRVVWSGQDVAMWALLNFYDVELTVKKERLGPLHKFKRSDFRRVTDKPGQSNFFGFQSSQKSFLTNLVVVVAACLLLYWKAPREGLLRAVYDNTALTTAALVFGFLVADTVGPWLLIQMICALSRLRDAVLFFVRKVKL